MVKQVHDKSIVERLASSIVAEGLLPQKAKLLVALSGGVDSMVLLHLLLQLAPRFGWQLFGCHVNHGLRAEESDRDRAFVAKELARLSIPAYVATSDLPPAGNVQALAREHRLHLFKRILEAHGLDRVVLAHHADDQAELFFQRLLTGAGLPGLGGMQKSRQGIFVRPLLDFRKRELLLYSREQRVAFVEDSSNQKATYLRNRLRQQLLPVFEASGADGVKSLMTLMANVRQENAFIEEMAEKALDEVAESQRDAFLVDLRLFSVLHPVLQLRLLKLMATRLQGGRLSRPRLLSLEELVGRRQGSEELHVGEGLYAYRDYAHLELRRGKRAVTAPFFCKVSQGSLPRTFKLESHQRRIVLLQRSCFNLEGGADRLADALVKETHQEATATINLGAFQGEIVLRSWQAGDRIQLPKSSRSRKLKSYFAAKKISREKRQASVIIADTRFDERVVAILHADGGLPGAIIDKRYLVSDKSGSVLHVSLERL